MLTMKNLIVLWLICLFSLGGRAQTSSGRLGQAFSAFQSDDHLKFGCASLCVIDAGTGRIVFSENGGQGMAPASTLKTLTSVACFDKLGEDFVWQTRLAYTGTISGGVLRGNLVIVGGGDPTLGSDRYASTKPSLLLSRWMNAVKAAGINSIEGDVIGDDSQFGSQITPQGWIWQDIGNYYGGGASSLSWRENEFAVSIMPGTTTGTAVRLKAEENVKDLQLINEIKTGAAGSGDNVYGYGAPYTHILYLRGTYGKDLKKLVRFANPDPALQLADDLTTKLGDAGISVKGKSTTARILSNSGGNIPSISKVIDVYSSPSLARVVYWLNQKSINLYAENMLKTLALSVKGEAYFEKGTEALQDFINQKLNADRRGLAVLDGSGLSPENRVTTSIMAGALAYASKQPWFESFYSSLPLYNNMKMKSGSIRNVLCYAGVQKNKNSTLVFSFITNNYNGSTAYIKQRMFQVLDLLK